VNPDGRGSGIFLHVSHHSPTAGCVSFPEADLLSVLRWMRPGARILIGPTRWLRSLKAPNQTLTGRKALIWSAFRPINEEISRPGRRI
jgi:hypothetical protein